jgi:hypothetical protein
MNIGWPEGIYLGLTVFGLLDVAAKHGQYREPYDFSETLASTLIVGILLYWGGFFS